VVLWARDETENTAAETRTDTSILTDNDFVFYCEGGEAVFIYDEDAWELMECSYFTPDFSGSTDLIEVVRASYGSTQHSFPARSKVLRVWGAFATHSISDMTLPLLGKCSFPAGVTQDIDFKEGHARFGSTEVTVQDTDGAVTRRLQNTRPINRHAVILAGYSTMPFSDYSMVWAGRVNKLNYRAGTYQLSLDADMDKLNRELWGRVEDFADGNTTTLTGDINDSQTTLTLADVTNIYDGPTFDNAGVAAHLAVKDTSAGNVEHMKITGLAGSTPTVVRAQHGTTAAAVTVAESEVRYFMSYTGNPLTIALVMLMSRDTSIGVSHATYDAHLGGLGLEESVGLSMQPSDIDVTGIETLRDRWFTDQTWIVNSRKRSKGLKFIEKHILKPLNCAFYITRSGKLSIAYVKPPVPTDELPVELNTSNVVGAPELAFDRQYVINDVTVDWDYDVYDDTTDSQTIVLNATSQSEYDRDGTMTLEPRGVVTSQGGARLATQYAGKKVSSFGRPLTPIAVQVLFNVGAPIEPGDVLQLNHSALADPDLGTTTFDRDVLVVSKRVDWAAGTVELDLLHPFYSLGRVGLLGPTGMATWANATDTDKRRYIWLGDTDNKLSTNEEGYVLY
jgi:hypothetical protein